MMDSLSNDCVDVNIPDEKDILEIDIAWRRKNYSEVLSRLQKDELFPENFKIEDLNEEDEVQRNLKKFAEERNRLHEWIKEGKLKEIREHISSTEPKYYFNAKDQSAAFTAIENKKFEIYAYLKTVNVKLHELEMNILRNLTKVEKVELAGEIRSYFPTNEKSHILYLISKSKPNSQNRSTYEEKITKFFEELNKIPEVSIILKVNQFVNNLEINFDFDYDNIQNMFPAESGKGLTLDNQGIIYIAAGRGRSESEILGTMAHEFTHMAMHLVFDNNRKPFSKYDKKTEKEFETIRNKCREMKKKEDDGPSLILAAVFDSYSEEVHGSELIVRIPHILMQYNDNGKTWLLKNTPDLYTFYLEKIVPECEKFVNENYLLKPRNFIRNLNETEGEVRNIQKCGLRFKNIEKLSNFVNDFDKNIFVLTTQDTWIGLLRIYQVFCDDLCMSQDRFLILKFENFLDRFEDVECAFRSKLLDILIVECPNILNGTNKISKMFAIVKEKKWKRIVFVMKKEDSKNLYELVAKAELKNIFKEVEDEDFTLAQLDDSSCETFLDKPITFQDREMHLRDLINNDKDLINSVNAEMIGKLLTNKKLKFGNKPFGTSSLDGAYADIYYKINLGMFVQEIEKGDDIFVVDGIMGLDKKMKFFEFLGKNFDVTIVEELINYKIKISKNKQIFLTGCETSEKNFKRFCNYNPTKKIYLIEKKFEDEVIFMLKKVYNPNFYLDREFKIPHVAVHEQFLEKSYYLKGEDGDYVKNNVIVIRDKNEKPMFCHRDIKWLCPKDANNNFKKLSKPGKIVHLLKMKNDKLIWMKSYGSLSCLSEHIIKESNPEIWTENDLIKDIIHKNVVIFADDPGMGKSTALTKLYEFKCIADNHWVIRIDLRNHIGTIKGMIREIINLDIVKNFLKEVDSSLKNKFCWDLLNTAFDKNKNFPKQLLLAFDGFDELFDQSDRLKVISLLKFLKDNVNCKIWITTRVQFKNILEDQLSTFAIRFVPISDPSKVIFIDNYLRIVLKLVLNCERYNEIFEKDYKTLDCSKLFLEKIKMIFKNNVESFIGTPLQLHLLLEGSLESFLNWVKNRKGDPEFSFSGNDIYELFRRFFTRKYDIYFKKKGIVEENQQRREKFDYEGCHELLAVKQYITCENRIQRKWADPLLLIGIVNEKLEFLHFTFREYFFAQYFVKILNEEQVSVLIEKFEYFLCTVLFENWYQLIRSFINFMLKSRKKKQLLNISFENEFKNNILRHAFIFCDSVLHVAINEGNNYLFSFLFMKNFSLLEYECLLQLTNMKGQTLLHVSILTENDYVLDLLINVMAKMSPTFQYEMLTIFDSLNRTVLDLAVDKNNIKIMGKILNLAEKISSNEEMVSLICKTLNKPELSTSAFEKAAIFGHCDIFKYLFKIVLRNRCKERIFDLFTPDSCDNYGFKILLLLANLNKSRPADQMCDGLSLHRNKECHVNIFKYILDKARANLGKEKFYKLFHSLWFYQFQHSIIFDSDIIELLVKIALDILPDEEKNDKITFDQKLFKCFYQLITMVDQTGQNLLEIAIMSKRSEIINLILNKLPPEKRDELLCIKDYLQQTSLHNSCIIGDTKIVKLLIPDSEEESMWEKQYELMRMKDYNGQTPFHLAALYGYFNVVEMFLGKLKRNLSVEKFKIYLSERNAFEYTPLDLAKKKKHFDISSIILKELKL